MRTGPPFVSFFFLKKKRNGKEGEALCDHYRELHQATGTNKPGASQKAKALWTMKAANDRDDEFYDRARKNDIQGRTRNRLELREEHLQSPVAALTKAKECLEAVYDC